MKLNFTKRKKALALLMSVTIAAGLTGCAENAKINSSVNGDVFESNVYSTENKAYTEEKTDVVEKKELNSANENNVETAYEITDWNTADLLNNLTVFGVRFINDGHIAQQELENSEKYLIESLYSDYLNQTYACINNKDGKEITFGFKGDVTGNVYAEKIVYLTIGSNLDGIDNVLPKFNISGVTETSTYENVIETLGKTNLDKNSKNSLVYCLNDGNVIFWFNSDASIKCVQMYLEVTENDNL